MRTRNRFEMGSPLLLAFSALFATGMPGFAGETLPDGADQSRLRKLSLLTAVLGVVDRL